MKKFLIASAIAVSALALFGFAQTTQAVTCPTTWPAALTNWYGGCVIPAGWLNAVETTIGTTTNSLSLQQQINNISVGGGGSTTLIHAGSGISVTQVGVNATATNIGVLSINGATGTVTISSSSLGVIYNSSWLTAAVQTLDGLTTSTISFATSTSAGTWNITTSNGNKITFTIPPAGDQYFAPSTTIPTNTNQLTNGAGFITGNQSITLKIGGDATGTASGATSITDLLNVTGLESSTLPALATGSLVYLNGSWQLINPFNITGTAGDISSTVVAATTTLDLANVITSGSCTNCNITYDAHGRVTVAANGSGSGGSSTILYSGNSINLSPNPISVTGTVNLVSSTASGSLLIGSGAGGWANVVPTSTSPLTWTYASGSLSIACATCVTTTTGNWVGTWQGVNSSTFYLASNPNGYITTSTNNFGGLTNASITANAPITWSAGSVIGFNTSTNLSLTGYYDFLNGLSLGTSTSATGYPLYIAGNVSSTGAQIFLQDTATSSYSEYNLYCDTATSTASNCFSGFFMDNSAYSSTITGFSAGAENFLDSGLEAGAGAAGLDFETLSTSTASDTIRYFVGGNASSNLKLTIASTSIFSAIAFNASGTISQNGTAVVLQSRNVNTTGPITGGGALSSDLTIACATCSTVSTSTANTWTATQTFPNIIFQNATGTSSTSSVSAASGTFANGYFGNIYDGGATTTQCEGDSTGLIGPQPCVTTFNGQSGAINFNVIASNGATTTKATSGGNTTTTVSVLLGAYLGLDANGNITPSSTLASSSVTFEFQNATTTAPAFQEIKTFTAKTIQSIDCWEYSAATTTIELGYSTSTTPSTIPSSNIIFANAACGINGFTTSTLATTSLPINSYLIAVVSSTSGTPTLTTLDVSATKL